MGNLRKYISAGVFSGVLQRAPGAFDNLWALANLGIETEYYSRKVKIKSAGTDAVITSTGYYSINGAAYQTGAATISDGDILRAKATSSADYSDQVTVVITIGGTDCTFSLTTMADPHVYVYTEDGDYAYTEDGDYIYEEG